MPTYLGIEIGGTKLQIGLGTETPGSIQHVARETVHVEAGGAGIRERICRLVPNLLSRAHLDLAQLDGAGIGFGGPVDDANQTTITSHQINGWDQFPLAHWMRERFNLRAVLGNDADVAGLAEATLGAGKDHSPTFYVTVGSGIGGALIINGDIFRGVGKGAAEIGHLRITDGAKSTILEHLASGWAIARRAGEMGMRVAIGEITAPIVAAAATRGDAIAERVLSTAISALADGLCHVLALLCPRRIVIGGGVSLLGEQLFEPLRRLVAERVFRPFADCYEIVPAALGEEVVLHGALTLARQRLGNERKESLQ